MMKSHLSPLWQKFQNSSLSLAGGRDRADDDPTDTQADTKQHTLSLLMDSPWELSQKSRSELSSFSLKGKMTMMERRGEERKLSSSSTSSLFCCLNENFVLTMRRKKLERSNLPFRQLRVSFVSCNEIINGSKRGNRLLEEGKRKMMSNDFGTSPPKVGDGCTLEHNHRESKEA